MLISAIGYRTLGVSDGRLQFQQRLRNSIVIEGGRKRSSSAGPAQRKWALSMALSEGSRLSLCTINVSEDGRNAVIALYLMNICVPICKRLQAQSTFETSRALAHDKTDTKQLHDGEDVHHY